MAMGLEEDHARMTSSYKIAGRKIKFAFQSYVGCLVKESFCGQLFEDNCGSTMGVEEAVGLISLC